ncbi:MAG TPA: 16S rRNA (cytidine(1402)-2'-O)-methyltransferase [Gammaproteobacteria bacterium]|nr:16S rRNA (cytidine(1402)-2'-O)-methyltransferase [Gammaproteobacteria bacterium]
MTTQIKPGRLYIVATPIGHLGDITVRAIDTLRGVDRIAAEDTRHSLGLLKHLGIEKPLVALHEHNEREQAEKLLAFVEAGNTLALISDAGTPLISDPGYHLVQLAHQLGIQVVPIPGPCSMITALSASGLPTDRFVFEGFLSAKATARRKQLEKLATETRTLVFFEAPHRILETLEAMQACFGEQRLAVVARELTKTFETIRMGSLSELGIWIKSDAMQQRGEFVVLVAGQTPESIKDAIPPESLQVLKILLSELSVKQAAGLAAKITGISKGLLYEMALKYQKE